MQHDDRAADETYGPWPWIAGIALGVGLIALMFSLAQGFS